MNKSLTATASGTSRSNGRVCVIGNIKTGTAGTIGRHISMELETSTLALLLAGAVNDTPLELAELIRKWHVRRHWRTGREAELDEVMLKIADALEQMPAREAVSS